MTEYATKMPCMMKCVCSMKETCWRVMRTTFQTCLHSVLTSLCPTVPRIDLVAAQKLPWQSPNRCLVFALLCSPILTWWNSRIPSWKCVMVVTYRYNAVEHKYTFSMSCNGESHLLASGNCAQEEQLCIVWSWPLHRLVRLVMGESDLSNDYIAVVDLENF